MARLQCGLIVLACVAMAWASVARTESDQPAPGKSKAPNPAEIDRLIRELRS